MNSKNINPKFSKYLEEQANYQDSPFAKFYNHLTLVFILKNLSKQGKREFIGLLEKERFGEIPEFLGKNIHDFSKRLKQENIKQVKKTSYED